jgi:hypothetical protein
MGGTPIAIRLRYRQPLAVMFAGSLYSVIMLKRENFTLPRAKDADRRIDLSEFLQHVTQGSIHLVALNEDIDRGVYCVRRVLTERLVGGGWNCRITVDRPVKGRDVDKVIRDYDRVHFLAEVIGTTTLPLDTNTEGHSNPVQLELRLPPERE